MDKVKSVLSEFPKCKTNFIVHVRRMDRVPIATFAAYYDGEDVLYAVSVCGKKDQFSRVVGRRVAIGRIFSAIAQRGSDIIPNPHHARMLELVPSDNATPMRKLFEEAGFTRLETRVQGLIRWEDADATWRSYLDFLNGKKKKEVNHGQETESQ